MAVCHVYSVFMLIGTGSLKKILKVYKYSLTIDSPPKPLSISLLNSKKFQKIPVCKQYKKPDCHLLAHVEKKKSYPD